MKYFRLVTLLVVAAGLTALAQPVLVPVLGPRYQQTRERVEELFRYRNGKAPPLDPQVNLFRVSPNNRDPVEVPVQTKHEPAASDEVILKLAIATLGKAGTVIKDDRSYLVVDKKRYEEGDFVLTVVRGKQVRLQVKRVGQNTATLAYNSAEQVAKF